MGLRFRGACADRAPRNEIRHILRTHRIERFRACGQTEFGNVEQQLARFLQPLFDMERIVHVRVVNHAFPTRRGARFFEIHAHDDEQCIADFVGKFFQAMRIIHRSNRIVHRTRADDHEQTRIAPIENLFDD